MSTVKGFLKRREERLAITQEVYLEGFDEPFIIKAISNKENERLAKNFRKTRLTKGGKRESVLDDEAYGAALVVQSIVTPDLHNAEIQEFYGTQGDAIATLKEMVSMGEYLKLQNAISKLNGFDEDDEEIVEEVKK